MSGGMFSTDDFGALVFDVGHSSFRAGFAGYDYPKIDIPTVIGTIEETVESDQKMDVDGPDQNDAANNNSTGNNIKYVFGGPGVRSVTPNMEINSFLKDGMIENWDLFEIMLEHLYKRHIYIDSSENPVLFSEAAWNTRNKREKLCELMFEKFKLPAFFVSKNAVLSAFANGKSTGLIFDSGATHSSAIPVHDGQVIQGAIVKSPLGGDFLANHCKKYFEDKNIEIIPSYMIESKEAVKEAEPAKWTAKTLPDNLTESWKNYMIKEHFYDFKAHGIQVTDSGFDKEHCDSMPSIHYEFPNGYNLDLTSSRFWIPEALFDTSFIKAYTSSVMGMSQIVTSSVGLCEQDIRASIYSNVVVTGGNTLINGFTDRLSRDLTSKTPHNMRYKLVIPTVMERRYASWIGGSILGSLGSFHQMWISKQEYEEEGKGIIEKKCP